MGEDVRVVAMYRKVVQAGIITDTSSTESQHTGPHCMWARGAIKLHRSQRSRFSSINSVGTQLLYAWDGLET